MKRYTTCAEGYCVEIEEADGDWVRFEDAEAELAKLRAVVDALPRCDTCQRPATFCHWNSGATFCDACSGPPGAAPFAWADAVRAL